MASSGSDTSNFDTESFIIAIKNRPILWDQTKREYSDRNAKKKAWEEIGASFIQDFARKKAKEKSAAGVALQKRWKGIRDSHTREINKKVKGSSGASNSKEYLYSHLLSFLNRTTRTRSSRTLPSSLLDDDHSTDVDNHSTTATKKARKSTCDEEEKLIQILIQRMDNKNQDKDRSGESEHEKNFLLSLVDDLRAIHSDYKMDAKMEIMRVLKKYKQI